MIKIVLAGEPVGKGRHRSKLMSKIGDTGKAQTFIMNYPAPKTARFEDRLAWAAQVAMVGKKLLEGPLEVALTAYVSIPASKSAKWKAEALAGRILPTKKPDWDNFAKCSDALNKVVWIDDSQVVTAFVCKRYSDQPRMEIIVSPCLTQTI